MLDSGQYTNAKYVREFENQFGKYFNAKYCVAVNNGTSVPFIISFKHKKR